MVKIWTSDQHKPSGAVESLHVYNGLDCCVTLEVLQAIKPQLNEITQRIYDFELALQAPILEMECRGVLVDQGRRDKVLNLFLCRHDELCINLAEIINEGLNIECRYEIQLKGPHKDKFYWTGFNPNSPEQLKQFFYGTFGLPPVRNRGSITADRKALEKLRNYFHVETIVRHILAIRDLKKKIGVLKTGIDPDGRIRTSYNIAGTDTGRLSSYQSALGSGTNLQNITGELRSIFTADPGKKFAYIDLQQGESYAVGAILWNLFKDGRYLDACESGDLHTKVSQMVFPHLPWVGDKLADKIIAEQPFYRHFTFRYMSKRLGHGTNYLGQPPHMAKQVNVPLDVVIAFRAGYIRAYGMDQWHDWVRQKLIRDGWITTFLGRHRFFFGRRFDAETLRSAVAFEPQSVVGDYINQGMINIWRSGICELMLQVHDALVIQYPEEREAEIIPVVQQMLRIEVPLLHGRSLIIPTDAEVGFNWGKYDSEKNPDGIIKYNGNDSRKRSAQMSKLDRLLRTSY